MQSLDDKLHKVHFLIGIIFALLIFSFANIDLSILFFVGFTFNSVLFSQKLRDRTKTNKRYKYSFANFYFVYNDKMQTKLVQSGLHSSLARVVALSIPCSLIIAAGVQWQLLFFTISGISIGEIAALLLRKSH